MEKVLIVEDDDLLREEISNLLREEGYKTYSSSDVQYAFRLFEEHAPDVVLSDINLKENSGYDFLKLLNEQKCSGRFAFIFLSAKNSMEEIRYGLSLGADDYIRKPFNYAEILSSIRTRIKKMKF